MRLLIASVMYRSTNGSFKELFDYVTTNKIVLLKYCVPAGALALYDLMSFASLMQMPPSQYMVLIQLRVVLTAFLWQFVMKTWLSLLQWATLLSCIWAVLLTEREMVVSMFSGAGLVMTLAPY